MVEGIRLGRGADADAGKVGEVDAWDWLDWLGLRLCPKVEGIRLGRGLLDVVVSKARECSRAVRRGYSRGLDHL